MPAGLRFLVALHLGANAFVAGGPAERVSLPAAGDQESLWTPGLPAIALPYAVIHFPPFSLALASDEQAKELPHVDYGRWLEDEISERRQVSLLLPVVDDAVGPLLGGALLTS